MCEESSTQGVHTNDMHSKREWLANLSTNYWRPSQVKIEYKIEEKKEKNEM
jgi:hypothetical protein